MRGRDRAGVAERGAATNDDRDGASRAAGDGLGNGVAEAPLRGGARYLYGISPRAAAIALGSLLLLISGEVTSGQMMAPLTRAQGILGAVCTAAGLATLLAAVAVRRWHGPRRWWRPRVREAFFTLALALAVWSVLLLGLSGWGKIGVPRADFYPSDVTWFTYVNAELVLHGRNPYTSNDAFWSSLRSFPQVLGTPMRRGAFAGSENYPPLLEESELELQFLAHPATMHGEFDPATLHSYPALSFLVYVPVAWAGPQLMLLLNVLAYLALVAWLVWRAPRGARGWALLLALAAATIPRYSLVLDTEVVCVLLLLPAWALRRWRGGWLAAVLLGLACAFKQYSWFFAPFFVLDALLSRGWRAALRQGLLALAAFLVPNLPFLLASPSAWWASLWLPMNSAMFPMGVSFVALSIGHVLPYFAARVYTVLEIATFAGALGAYARWHARLEECALLLAVVPLFFAYRATENYFAFAPWFALYAVFCARAHRASAHRASTSATVAPQAAPAVAGTPA